MSSQLSSSLARLHSYSFILSFLFIFFLLTLVLFTINLLLQSTCIQRGIIE